MNIKVKYFKKDMVRLNKTPNGDWIDLRSADTIMMQKGEFRLIPLGIAVQLPKNHEAHIVPRSSTFRNFKIIQTNSPGIVDESYCGDNDQWFFPAYAMENTVILENDRICQFRVIEKMPDLSIEEVDELGNDDRGGHGSSGIK
jgi:dUTP pyrophosphatase